MEGLQPGWQAHSTHLLEAEAGGNSGEKWSALSSESRSLLSIAGRLLPRLKMMSLQQSLDAFERCVWFSCGPVLESQNLCVVGLGRGLQDHLVQGLLLKWVHPEQAAQGIAPGTVMRRHRMVVNGAGMLKQHSQIYWQM